MKPSDAAFVLSMLTASFNQHPFTDEDPRRVVWANELQPLRRDVALDAIDQLRGAEDRLPSIARFRSTYQAVLRRRHAQLAIPEATGEPLPMAENAERARALRKALVSCALCHEEVARADAVPGLWVWLHVACARRLEERRWSIPMPRRKR